MKLSKKTEYALRSIAAMAREPLGTTFSIHQVATSERIPLKFLEQILVTLKNGGLLRSKRGVGGGYQLTREPAAISLRQVVEIIDGPFQPITCSGAVASGRSDCECGVTGGCGLGKTLSGLRDTVTGWLDGVTIATVVENERRNEPVSFEI